MSRTSSRRIPIVLLCLAAPLALVACGGGGDDSSSTASTSAPTSAAGAGAATVDLADTGDLGEVLVDADGRTLYLFEKDDEGDESYCSGACAKTWPPATTDGKPEAGDGLDAAKLTSFKRDDGSTQLAYADHPLYRYADDTAPGDATGNGLDQFGAEWYALDIDGNTVEGGGEAAGASQGSGSGY